MSIHISRWKRPSFTILILFNDGFNEFGYIITYCGQLFAHFPPKLKYAVAKSYLVKTNWYSLSSSVSLCFSLQCNTTKEECFCCSMFKKYTLYFFLMKAISLANVQIIWTAIEWLTWMKWDSFYAQIFDIKAKWLRFNMFYWCI